MAAELAQSRECLENGEALAVEAVEARGAEHHVLGAGKFVALQLLLHAGHLAEHGLLSARGQLLGHLAFGAADHEWPQPR